MNIIGDWLSGLLNSLGNALLGQGFDTLATTAFRMSNWLIGEGSGTLGDALGFVFWPFKAITDGTILGSFTLAQALAPAMLLLYATILFILAARYFSRKDLFFSE